MNQWNNVNDPVSDPVSNFPDQVSNGGRSIKTKSKGRGRGRTQRRGRGRGGGTKRRGRGRGQRGGYDGYTPAIPIMGGRGQRGGF